MKDGRYAAIVLAGGFSSRMQKFKPLLPLGKGTIADHLIATFLRTGTDVYLVVGYRGMMFEPTLKPMPFRLLRIPIISKVCSVLSRLG